MGRESRRKKGQRRVLRGSRPSFLPSVGLVRRLEGAADDPPDQADVEVPQLAEQVMLASPAGATVHIPFHRSVLAMFDYEMKRPARERRLAKIVQSSGLYVADNRTACANLFFDMEPSDARRTPWLLMIDTDIRYPPTILEDAVQLAHSAGAKVLGINVPLGNWPCAAFVEVKERAPLHDPLWPLPTSRVFECDAIATAVCLIHRDVLEAIADGEGRSWFNHLYVPYVPDGARPMQRNTAYHSIGEDFAFCARARRYGFRIHCAHGLPGMEHHKLRPLSEHGQREESMAVHRAMAKELDNLSAEEAEAETGELIPEGIEEGPEENTSDDRAQLAEEA